MTSKTKMQLKLFWIMVFWFVIFCWTVPGSEYCFWDRMLFLYLPYVFYPLLLLPADVMLHWSSLYSLGLGHTENTVFNSSSILACLFVVCVAMSDLFDDIIPCLLCHYLAMDDISCKAIRSCHIAPSLKLLIARSLQPYHHFLFSEGTCLWHLWLSSQMACQNHARVDTSSSLDSIQTCSMWVGSHTAVHHLLPPYSCLSWIASW
jgi:hypothetical protein